MLEVKDVKKYFGGVRAVDGVSMEVKEHSITGLIGANGAGKTTLFNCISGFLPMDGGDVLFKGESLKDLKPYDIAKKGIIRTFQTPKGFPRMTVTENMMAFAKLQDTGALAALLKRRQIQKQEAENLEKAITYLDSIGLEKKKDFWVSELSAGELKLLEFCRPLMFEPSILLLDEPAAGVNPASLGSLTRFINNLREKGMTFLIVDHNLKFIMQICDYIYVMADGKLISSGAPADVANDEKVIESYIGRKKSEAAAS